MKTLLPVTTASLFLVGLSVAARADHADHPHHRAPPPEAIAACKSLAKGDACTVTFGDHTIAGTCDAPPDGAELACRPDHPPGPPPESLAACKAKSEGDACSFTLGEHAISGTCSKGPHGEAELGCRPEHPPDRD